MERKNFISTAICGTVALVILICIVVNLASSSDGVAPITQNTSVAMDTTTTTARPPPPDIETIYVACGDGGIRAFSLATSRLQSIYSSSGVHAVTYDFIRHKVYWTRAYEDGSKYGSILYRAGPTGDSVQALLVTQAYGKIYGLDFDWIASVLYAVSLQGFVIACSTWTMFRCATVISGQGNVEGVAVDPIHGRLYWTEGNQRGSIFRSGTDGSNTTRLLSDQNRPRGIVIDFQEWRLYWTCQGSDIILSSDMDGQDIRTIRLPNDSSPQGIAVWGDTIYWTHHFGFKLQSIEKNGEGNRTLNTGSYHLYHLAVLPTLNPPSNRTNHCASANCSGVCVLSDVSFRCLS